MPEPQVHIYEFGPFRVDAAKRLLFGCGGQPLSLTPKAFDTLLYLVEHSEAVVDKEELLKAIWPDTIVEENNLNQNISAVRRVLGEKRAEHNYIVTVPGHGYRFVAEVRTRTTRTETPATATVKAIAVLPFMPLVAEHRDAALELGMADTLIARLSGIREVVVRPTSSVRKYVDLDQNPLVAGQELGVESVLEGSIQRWGDSIRVTVRLMMVSTGAALWAGTFDEKFTNIFAVQDAIAQKVADALELPLSGEAKLRLTNSYTLNAAAYELYMKGRYYWNKLTPPDIRKSIEFFQQAIDLDPNYALAHMGLGEAYRSLPITSDAPPKEAFPLAKAAEARALEIDESLADAHANLVFTKFWYDWDWDGAEIEAHRALALNPNSADAHRAYAHLLSDLGRHDEAIAEAARARELDPLALITRTLESQFLYYAGRDVEAREKLTKTLEISPNFWVARLTLGKIYLRAGEYAEAVAEFTAARDFSGGNTEPISLIGYTWALAGNRAQALAVLDELHALSTQRYVPPHNIAMVYNGLGEDDKALAWLERAFDERDVRLSFLKVDSKWDRFRSHPRFADLIRRVGLPQ
jgi:DNA-binding winged helix-turn-helix (wHTH) protein/Flp pilus assembly protein TadD